MTEALIARLATFAAAQDPYDTQSPGRPSPASAEAPLPPAAPGPAAPARTPLPAAPAEAAAAPAEILADRPDGTVLRAGRAVVKAHAPDCDPRALAVRLRIAAHPRLQGTLLPPLPVAGPGGFLALLDDGRPVTRWPYGSPVPPDGPQESAPWEDTARLLARLHAMAPDQLPGPIPPMRGPAKAARALTRLRTAAPSVPPAATAAVERAWSFLPPWARAETPWPAVSPGSPGALCHGDFHLGQLVRHPAPYGPWTLIDIDDLGLGDPAWDLARPAAWYATGLLAPGIWSRFLAAYRHAHGPAVRPEGDPWPQLEVPARALTVQTAALALAKAAARARPLDETEEAFVDACARMTSLPSPLADPSQPVV